jgi:hypothetical protein
MDCSKFIEDEKFARNLKGMGVSELEKRSIDDDFEFKSYCIRLGVTLSDGYFNTHPHA